MSLEFFEPASLTSAPESTAMKAPLKILGKSRKVGPEQAPYLKGIPQLTDQDARLTRRFRLTKSEESHLDKQVKTICQQIREARKAWQLDYHDEILWD